MESKDLLKLLNELSGNETKIFFILLIAVNDDYEYKNMELLTEFDFSYPTVLQSVEKLVELKCIKKIDTGSVSKLKLGYEYRKLSDNIKEFFNGNLPLMIEKEFKKKKEPKVDIEDLRAIINHYASEQGIIEIYPYFYKINIRSAKKLLLICGNVENAKQAISNCRIIRQMDGLEWSLNGDVLNNIHKFHNKNQKQGEAKKWD